MGRRAGRRRGGAGALGQVSVLRLSNEKARWLWLDLHGLGRAPVGKLDVAKIATDLGFVQLDSIRYIERAHDHIVWSRNQRYRVGGLEKALRARQLFEHFTHDASLIPMQYLPQWQRQFERRAEKIRAAGWWKGMTDAEGRAEMKARIAREGPLSTKDFESDAPRPKGMWQRPAHKQALDYMWYSGELATCHRDGFVKHYDLAERVFPEALRAAALSHEAQIDALCRLALERLGVATAGEIQRFWDACSAAEIKAWLSASEAELIRCEVENHDGSVTARWALPSLAERLDAVQAPSGGARILSPFDPAIRDRKRTERLFGFDYKIEIFVPEAKRRWGYYVYPILMNGKLVARVDLKPDRKAGTLRLEKLWSEGKRAWSRARQNKLDAELRRFARFAGLDYLGSR